MTRCCADSCVNQQSADGAAAAPATAAAAFVAADTGDPVFYVHVADERTLAADSPSSDADLACSICECTEGFSYDTCGSLGAAVGVQLSLEYCHVVDCGHTGLTTIPSFPSTTTKLDIQNNMGLTEIPLGSLDALTNTANLYASST